MINELNEMLKKYSNGYFIEKFEKIKPSVRYNRLKRMSLTMLIVFLVAFSMFVLSIGCWDCLGAWRAWGFGGVVLCMLASVFCLCRSECHKTRIQSGMAYAYLKKHGSVKAKLPKYGSFNTVKEHRQYVYFVKNAYRAEIVRTYLGNEYNLESIKAMRDIIAVKDVKFRLGFFSFLSLFSLGVSLGDWQIFDGLDKLNSAIGVAVLLAAVYVIGYLVMFGIWCFKVKKYSALSETLTFILYDMRK